LRSRAEAAGLPLPRYAWEDPYLALTLFRSPEAAAKVLDPKLLAALTDTEQSGWQWLARQGRASSSRYAKAMQVDERTARRHLGRFVGLGLVRKEGSGPSTEYVVR